MSEASRSEFRQIGRPLLRKEDYRLLTGQARYVDDIAVPGALHAHFVRSPHAHARIRAIAAERARAMPGVVAVTTGRDLLQWTTTMRMAPPIAGTAADRDHDAAGRQSPLPGRSGGLCCR